MSRLAAKPCWEDMRRQLTFRCEDHEDLSNCPDSLVVYSENSGQFGIRVHDRGSSSIAIRHCPWCGATLVWGWKWKGRRVGCLRDGSVGQFI